MQTFAIAALFLVFGVFLLAVTMAIMEGQKRTRREVRRVEDVLASIQAASLSLDERDSRNAHIREIDRENVALRSVYEYGGC